MPRTAPTITIVALVGAAATATYPAHGQQLMPVTGGPKALVTAPAAQPSGWSPGAAVPIAAWSPPAQAPSVPPSAAIARYAVARGWGSAAPAGYATPGYPALGYPAAGYPAAGYPAAGYPAPGAAGSGFAPALPAQVFGAAPVQSTAGPLGPPPAADRAASTGGRGLLIGGGLSLGLFYSGAALTGAALGKLCGTNLVADVDDVPEDVSVTVCDSGDVTATFIPLVGPFITVANLHDSRAAMWPLDVALVSLGLGQLTGAALLIAGVAKGGDEAAEPPAVTVEPIVGASALGLTVRGAL